jgi:hypothetical protein
MSGHFYVWQEGFEFLFLLSDKTFLLVGLGLFIKSVKGVLKPKTTLLRILI